MVLVLKLARQFVSTLAKRARVAFLQIQFWLSKLIDNNETMFFMYNATVKLSDLFHTKETATF